MNEFNTFYNIPHLLMGQFTKEDWERIVTAIKFYSDKTAKDLSTRNEGDGPWTELSRYEGIARDIEYFILPLNNEKQEDSAERS